MTSLTRHVLAVALVAQALIGLTPRDVDACSPAKCTPAALAPVGASEVSAAVPGFLFMPRFVWGGEDIAFTDASFVVESQAGIRVPFHLEQLDDAIAIRLDERLVEDTWYFLRYQEHCPSRQIVEPPLWLERHFHTGYAAMLPQDPPTFYPKSHQLETISVGTSSGMCVAEIEADVVRFSTRQPNAFYWEPVIRVETLVDGERWAITDPGEPDFASYGPGEAATTGMGRHRPTVLFTRCASPSVHEDPGLSPGDHQVEVRYLVYGTETSIPPLKFSVSLACPDGRQDGLTEMAEDSSDVVFDTSISELPGTDSAASLPDVPSSSSGCQANPTASPFALLVLMLLLVLPIGAFKK